MKPDLVIRGGLLVDGTGASPRETDVVVTGGRIVSTERFGGEARDVLDARGCIVTPGFVDIHTHLDAQILWDPLATPSTLHGVTTVVVGNCGVGFAPCRPEDREFLMFLMEGVEDIPRSAMQQGMEWGWVTFPEYLDFLERRPLGPNLAAHLSHAPLRIFVMGERGATDAEPDERELAAMRACVREALEAGAVGFSTGRTTMHRTPAWDPVPGTFASRRELETLLDGMREAGRGVFELVPYGAAGEDPDGLEREFEWLFDLSRRHGRPTSLALVQVLAYPDRWERAFERIDAEQAPVFPQVAVRSVGLLLSFRTALSPLLLFPAASELLGKPTEEVARALQDEGLRTRLAESLGDGDAPILGGLARLENVFFLEGDGVKAYETKPERSVVAQAKASGVSPGEFLLRRFLERNLDGFLLLPLYNPDLDAVATMLRHPRSTIGLGDAGAHTTQTSDASFPTFLLAYWVRERKLLSLEHAVRKLTSEPARLWGITDRGTVEPGKAADLDVIDVERLDLRLPEVRHEFPGGAAHLVQEATGYVATIVNGEVVVREGRPTGALPGRLLRGGRSQGTSHSTSNP
ncbi:MAG: amidohydrolase [Candidatus Binatia bacterium]|nr:MAG: amidohydrolase [Candidatus Binatia bacterium]